jgi:hypothetical protein
VCEYMCTLVYVGTRVYMYVFMVLCICGGHMYMCVFVNICVRVCLCACVNMYVLYMWRGDCRQLTDLGPSSGYLCLCFPTGRQRKVRNNGQF